MRRFFCCAVAVLALGVLSGCGGYQGGGGGGYTAPLSITTTSLPLGIVNVSYSATLQATGGTPPYTWTIKNGSLSAGLMLSSTGAITGMPTATGTSMFTVNVSDAGAPTGMMTQANLSITVGTANNAKLSGNYAFLFNGWNPNGLTVTAGSFIADGNGTIPSGSFDANGTTFTNLNVPFTGTYSIASDNLGTITLNTMVGTPITLAVVVQASGDAKIIEFDDTTGAGTRGSGVLKKQDTTAFSTAKITGDYALGFVGIDSAGGRFGLAGVFHAEVAGTMSNGLLDGDDNGTILSSTAFAGNYSVASSGRGTATLNITGGQGTVNYSFYVVSATELLAMQIDSVAAGKSLLSGSILQQIGADSFTNASLNGTSVVSFSELGSGTTPNIKVGVLTADGVSGLSVSADGNNGGVVTSQNFTATYSVASNGRVSVTPSSGNPLVFYLVSNNKAFITVAGGSAAGVGLFEPQSSGPFSNSSISGTYAGASTTPVNPNVSDEVDEFVVTSPGNFNITSDKSSGSGLTSNQMQSGTYSVAANGRTTVTINGVAGTAAILYIVSPTKFVGFGTDPNPKLLVFEQ